VIIPKRIRDIMTKADNQELLTTREVAEILRCKIRTVQNYAARGKLKSERYSKRMIRFTREAVETFRQGN
jgi:excisionase family DNA binding protein